MEILHGRVFSIQEITRLTFCSMSVPRSYLSDSLTLAPSETAVNRSVKFQRRLEALDGFQVRFVVRRQSARWNGAVNMLRWTPSVGQKIVHS